MCVGMYADYRALMGFLFGQLGQLGQRAGSGQSWHTSFHVDPIGYATINELIPSPFPPFLTIMKKISNKEDGTKVEFRSIN